MGRHAGIWFLFASAAFSVRVFSQSYEYDEALSFNQMTAYDKLVSDFLGSKILQGLDWTHLCDNPHAAFCGREAARNRSRPDHLKRAYRSIRNYLINILAQPIAISEVASLSVEKTLFRRCMNLGFQNDTANRLATERFVTDIFQDLFERVDNSSGWQGVDGQLNSRGFDRTFFDIAVEPDPDNPRRNIIVIQPPSLARVSNLREWTKMVFDPTDPPDRMRVPWKYYDSNEVVLVENFFSRWLQLLSQSSKQAKQERMSLTRWKDEYDGKSSGKEHAQIDWQQLIGESFDRLNVNVKASDEIIVRKKDYFFSLVHLLSDQSTPHLTTAAIKVKIIIENIRLVDFKYADALNHRKKALFCFDNTNLYGASYRLLRDLKRDDSNDEEHYEILNEMILDIADVFVFNIDQSNNLTPKEKRYLKAQVRLITWHVVKYKNVRETVDDYYENYDIHPSYLVSILKYRRMLKDKQLGSLSLQSQHNPTEPSPFSVIDSTKPRNRFVLNVLASSLLLSKRPVPFELQKEVHYGIYGVSIASFLYGLLNENRFDNEIDTTGRRVQCNWSDRPIYPYRSMQCLIGQEARSYGWRLASEAVTQIFGARMAYDAMLQDYEESDLIRPKEFLLVNRADSQLQAIDADRLFFMSYAKYHCHLGEKVLRTVLFNLNEYNSAFHCASTPRDDQLKRQCPLDAFQIQAKHHFVNIPF